MKSASVFLLATLLFSCSNTNQVERIESSQSVIVYQKNSPDRVRFDNLHPGEKHYPITCQEDCYPSSSMIECQTHGENCQFVDQQTNPNLNAGFTVRWLGHAGFHITSADGTSVLFDPVSKQFDWPVNWAFRLAAGFNRKPGAWLNENALEQLDAVMYSHIHYDHFNKADIDDLGNSINYYTPLGFADHFEQDGYKIKEMAWFSDTKLNELKVSFVPAHHFSNRILVPFIYEDNDASLWGGWLLEQNGKRLFFAGDTGYSKHFKDIQQRYGDIDVCLLPIASYYHPDNGRWYRYVHMTPEDALVAADDLNCKVIVPWGYGNASWKMGDHSSHSALLRLLKMHRQHTTQRPLYILNEGEEIKF